MYRRPFEFLACFAVIASISCNTRPILLPPNPEQQAALDIMQGPPFPQQGSDLHDYGDVIAALQTQLPEEQFGPVLSITVLNHTHAKVQTGTLRNLGQCSSGKQYWLVKSNGKWVLKLNLKWVS